jgi:hypothetical protein
MTTLTAHRLRELLHYAPETGEFRWRVDRGNKIKAGSIAGGASKAHGYYQIGTGGRLYYGHRLAWLYMTGEWPSAEIDHINRDKADNRFANLREATHQENCWNLPIIRSNKSGISGVRWHAGKWVAYICVSGEVKHLGRFVCKEEAGQAYSEAVARFRGSRFVTVGGEA